MALFLSVVMWADLHVECSDATASVTLSHSVHGVSLEVEIVSAGPVPVLACSLGEINWVGVIHVTAKLELL